MAVPIFGTGERDIAVIGREATAAHQDRLPPGVTIRHDERLVIIPRALLVAAKADIQMLELLP
jgi:hypothetical protein